MSPASGPGSHAPPPAGSAVAQPPPERVVARIRRHGRVLTVPVLLMFVVACLTPYAVFTVNEVWQRIAVGAVAALVIVLGTLLPLLAWLTRRWTVTTRRVIMRSGVFTRSRQELALSRAHDVTVRRTLGQRMFGAGDVRITTAHERAFVLHDVPAPLVVQAALDELIERSHRDLSAGRFDSGEADGDTVVWGTR